MQRLKPRKRRGKQKIKRDDQILRVLQHVDKGKRAGIAGIFGQKGRG